MCKSSKKNRTANAKGVSDIKPNTPGGASSGGGGTTAGPPAFDGVPEHVPELTFIVETRLANIKDDDFLNGATIYHTNCGLKPRTISSIEQLVGFLAEDTSRLKRIRIVGHSNGVDLIIPMFGSTKEQKDRHAFKTQLSAFAESDEAGLLSAFGKRPGNHFAFDPWNISKITSLIRAQNANFLTPFGLKESGSPPPHLEQFIKYCCDAVFVEQGRFKKNGSAVIGADKASLLKALGVLQKLHSKPMLGTKISAVMLTQSHFDSIKSFLLGQSLSDMGKGAMETVNFSLPADSLNPFWLVDKACDAIEGGFRAKLEKVRARFDENSSIDIRGCRAGEDSDYLKAFQKFIGPEKHLPKVNAPRWFQYFGQCMHKFFASNTEIHAYRTSGAEAANIRKLFDEWAERLKVIALHKEHWLTVLKTQSVRGTVTRFCMMEWRSKFPELPLKAPGLTAFSALDFKAAIAKTGSFLNVKGANIPSGAGLDTIATFVSQKLSGYATHLLAKPEPSKLQSIYLGLKSVNQDLGQNIVPASPPSPLNAGHITGWQDALNDFLDANQLAPIKKFMSDCQLKLEDSADNGLHYYMLHAGLPVFLFFSTEKMGSGHKLFVTKSAILVHNDFKQIAYRQWPPMSWAEPLPANSINTLEIGDDNTRRLAMMVGSADPGDVSVATCPHPSYFDKIVEVTNTPDLF